MNGKYFPTFPVLEQDLSMNSNPLTNRSSPPRRRPIFHDYLMDYEYSELSY